MNRRVFRVKIFDDNGYPVIDFKDNEPKRMESRIKKIFKNKFG